MRHPLARDAVTDSVSHIRSQAYVCDAAVLPSPLCSTTLHRECWRTHRTCLVWLADALQLTPIQDMENSTSAIFQAQLLMNIGHRVKPSSEACVAMALATSRLQAHHFLWSETQRCRRKVYFSVERAIDRLRKVNHWRDAGALADAFKRRFIAQSQLQEFYV